MRKNKKLRQDSAKAVKLIKQKREGRRQQLAVMLQSQYDLNGESLESEVDALQQRERDLHKNLLNLFVTQDGKTLSAMPDQMESLLNAGLALMPPVKENDAQRQQVQQLAAENAELTATISRLQQELEARAENQPSDPEVVPEEESEPEPESVIEVEIAEAKDAEPEEILDEIETPEAELNQLYSDEVDQLLDGFEIELADEQQNQSLDEDESAVDSEIPAEPEDIIDDIGAESLADDVQLDSVNEQPPSESVPDETVEQADEVSETAAGVVPAKASSLSDFAKSDWQPTVPDIYGKQPFNSPESAEITAEDTVAEPKQKSSLKQFMNSDWQPSVPPVYGLTKTEIPEANNETADPEDDTVSDSDSFEELESDAPGSEFNDITPQITEDPNASAEEWVDLTEFDPVT
ncbi:MAG: hypothetical protein WD177_02590, partial [Methylophaga sp.]